MADYKEGETCFKGLGGERSRTCINVEKCPDGSCPLMWVVLKGGRVSFVDPSINRGAMDGGRPRY